MNPVLAHIVDLLDVERIEENLYRGQNHDTEHVFGGQVLAQAIAAAFRTVAPEHQLHSLHAYFLRAGDWQVPILYEVDRIRDGRSFSTRRVVAIQHGRAIFNLSSSWQKREDGLEHGSPIPDVPPPEPLRGERETFLALAEQQEEFRRYAFRFEAIDSRHVERISPTDDVLHPPYRHTWMKARDPLPDNPEVHLALLAYMSDTYLIDVCLLPAGRFYKDSSMQVASLDHALWFHGECRADEWLLHVLEADQVGGGRGLGRGHFFTPEGRLVATVMQQGLMRYR